MCTCDRTPRGFPPAALKAFSAGIVLARFEPEVSAPVPERLDKSFQQRLLCQNTAAFSHGDVVSRIKTGCRNIAKGADTPALISCSHSIATIFHQPEIMAAG